MYLHVLLTSFIICFIFGCDGGDESRSPVDTNNDGNTTVETNVCDRLIQCYRDTGLAGVTAVIEAYGENGTCWSMDGVEASDCMVECNGALEAVKFTSPEAAACVACEADAECALFGFNTCYDGTCTQQVCGNGVIENNEVCDPGSDASCNDDCTHEYSQCYPLAATNQCGDGMKCVMDFVLDGVLAQDALHYFGCYTEGADDVNYGGYCEDSGRECVGQSICLKDDYADFYGECTQVCDLNAAIQTCDCRAFAVDGGATSTVADSNIGFCYM